MPTTAQPSRRSLTGDSRMFIGIIADMETTIGFLLAGIGETSGSNLLDKNFMVVMPDTPIQDVEQFFLHLHSRKNVGVIFVASEVRKLLTQALARVTKTIPIILEIPTKNTIMKAMQPKKVYKN